jgi:hypothetical protein
MPVRILNEDWSEYDNRKKRYVDRFFFSCEEPWEVSYLIGKIKKIYPAKSEASIRAAIESCCREIPAPRPRDKFVHCVMSKL